MFAASERKQSQDLAMVINVSLRPIWVISLLLHDNTVVKSARNKDEFSKSFFQPPSGRRCQLTATSNNVPPITVAITNVRQHNKIFQCTATDETAQIQIKAFDFAAKKFSNTIKVSFLKPINTTLVYHPLTLITLFLYGFQIQIKTNCNSYQDFKIKVCTGILGRCSVSCPCKISIG